MIWVITHWDYELSASVAALSMVDRMLISERCVGFAATANKITLQKKAYPAFRNSDAFGRISQQKQLGRSVSTFEAIKAGSHSCKGKST